MFRIQRCGESPSRLYVLRGTETQAINSLRQFAVTSPVTLCLSMEEKSIEIKKVRAKP